MKLNLNTMNWNPFESVFAGIAYLALFVIILVSLVAFAIWKFPTSNARTYDWGRLVCTERKPANSWVTTNMDCKTYK